jgi:DNA polymerase delta subunit 4
MPTTRRQSGGNAASKPKAKPKAAQTKLAFHGSNRVTKGVPASPAGKKATPLEQDVKADAPTIELEEPESAESSLAEIAPPETQPLSAEEQRALKVKDAQIKKYWAEKEAARIAPRVHQEGISLHEKLLRQWDTDSKYGVGAPSFNSPYQALHLFCGPPLRLFFFTSSPAG